MGSIKATLCRGVTLSLFFSTYIFFSCPFEKTKSRFQYQQQTTEDESRFWHNSKVSSNLKGKIFWVCALNLNWSGPKPQAESVITRFLIRWGKGTRWKTLKKYQGYPQNRFAENGNDYTIWLLTFAVPLRHTVFGNCVSYGTSVSGFPKVRYGRYRAERMRYLCGWIRFTVET